jgi:hypothetical protein
MKFRQRAAFRFVAKLLYSPDNTPSHPPSMPRAITSTVLSSSADASRKTAVGSDASCCTAPAVPAVRLREGNIRACGTLSHDDADNGFAAARGGAFQSA